MSADGIHKISVIVPKNPFVRGDFGATQHCLAALNVENLMRWWPGNPHNPQRNPRKVRDIQRSLDWKRVAKIASYLLQAEIIDAPDLLNEFFAEIYEPRRLEPGREWPPKVGRVIGFERSAYPTFSNVLLHVNGAKVDPLKGKDQEAATLTISEQDAELHFSVIDGQHRINGAYFALKILQRSMPDVTWEIPSEIFIDLDPPGQAPRHQAQIFIDVNFNQKKVDRSLVADLFPTARGRRGPLDDKERAQDIGRKLMLEDGPLKGMIQIPGIKYGIKDVVTLATLNIAIEGALEPLALADITSLEEQTTFLAQCIDAFLTASGRKHDLEISERLDPENVAYQGRNIVSILDLVPACVISLRRSGKTYVSANAKVALAEWFAELLARAGLLKNGKFIPKSEFTKKGFHGTGGISRFRDTLWAAALSTRPVARLSVETRTRMASEHKRQVYAELSHES